MLDRVNSSVETQKIVPSMIEFSQKTQKDLVLEILFVKDLNDKDEEISLLYQALIQINPTRVDIGTIDRPPAYDVKPVSYEFLQSVANKFININVNIVYKNRPKSIQSFSLNEITSMLKRRPLTREDIENMFDIESKNILDSLIKDEIVTIIDSSGVDFYKCL